MSLQIPSRAQRHLRWCPRTDFGDETLASLCTAFSEVRQEESRRKMMLAPSLNDSTPTENSALAVPRQLVSNSYSRPTDPDSRGPPYSYPSKGKQGAWRLWCKRCNKPNHNLDICWKIHGKPADWRPARELRAHVVATEPSPNPLPFTKEQIDMLQNCLSSIHHPPLRYWYGHYSNSRWCSCFFPRTNWFFSLGLSIRVPQIKWQAILKC